MEAKSAKKESSTVKAAKTAQTATKVPDQPSSANQTSKKVTSNATTETNANSPPASFSTPGTSNNPLPNLLDFPNSENPKNNKTKTTPRTKVTFSMTSNTSSKPQAMNQTSMASKKPNKPTINYTTPKSKNPTNQNPSISQLPLKTSLSIPIGTVLKAEPNSTKIFLIKIFKIFNTRAIRPIRLTRSNIRPLKTILALKSCKTTQIQIFIKNTNNTKTQNTKIQSPSIDIQVISLIITWLSNKTTKEIPTKTRITRQATNHTIKMKIQT